MLVHDLDFTDDLALITENVNQWQILLSKLEEEAEKLNLFATPRKQNSKLLTLILKLKLRLYQEMVPIKNKFMTLSLSSAEL